MKFFLLTLLLLASVSARAQQLQYEGTAAPGEPLEQYFAAEDQNYNKSIIYVFYDNDACYDCPQTIDMIEQAYNRYYKDQYSLFVIDYQNDDEYNFIETYNLHLPLSVVLVRIDDGATFGFEKLDDLPNRISDPESFTTYFRFRVNSFLGNNG